MRATPTPLLPVLAITLIALTACTAPAPAPTDDPETYVSSTDAPADPDAVASPGPLDPDTTLVVTARATAANGATLALELRAHSGIRFDDVANQTIPAAFVEDCGFSAQQLAGDAWGFARANLTALPGDGAAWPADAAIALVPSAASVDTVGRGILSGESDCAADKTFSGPGAGAIALGIAGDAAGGSPTPTGWAQHAFGFSTLPGSGVTLSDCAFSLTDLGAATAGTTSWTQLSDATACMTGTLPERVER